MNIEKIQELIQSERKDRFNNSNQLSLGKLISDIVECGIKKEDGTPKDIYFDFCYAQPTFVHSWRGAYSELAISFQLTGRGFYENIDMDAEKFVDELQSAIGSTFEGWKGGEYKMYLDTPVWVSNEGDGCHTGVLGVFDNEYQLIIVTGYCEY